jgi:uncharacterized protein
MTMLIETKDAGSTERLDFQAEFKLVGTDPDSGVIEGYASVFGVLDRGADIVMPGAFRKTLQAWRKRKALPPMLWQHWDPIGSWTSMEEDEVGLKVVGEIVKEVPQGAICHALVRKHAVRGLSIGYRCLEHEMDRKTGARRILQADLFEVTVTPTPMLPEAMITSAKNFNPRDLERSLRDAGLSRSDAVKAVSVVQSLQRDAGEPDQKRRDDATDLIMSLRRATEAMRS